MSQHNHISHEQAVLQVERATWPGDIANCEICQERLKAASYSFQAIKKKQESAVQKKFQEIDQNIQGKKDLLAYLEQATVRLNQPSKTKPIAAWSAVAAAVLLALTFTINYQHDMFSTGLLAFDQEVQVQRAGLFWGSKAVKTQRILPGHDQFFIKNQVTITKNFTVYSKNGVYLRMSNASTLRLTGGEALVHFLKRPVDRTRFVFLPTGEKITVTGTTIYFNLSKQEQVTMVEGAATLETNKRTEHLKRGLSYNRATTSLQKTASETLAEIHLAYNETITSIITPRKETLRLIKWQSLLGKNTLVSTVEQRKLFNQFKNIYKVDFIEGGYFIAAQVKKTRSNVTYVLPGKKVTVPINAISTEIKMR